MDSDQNQTTTAKGLGDGHSCLRNEGTDKASGHVVHLNYLKVAITRNTVSKVLPGIQRPTHHTVHFVQIQTTRIAQTVDKGRDCGHDTLHHTTIFFHLRMGSLRNPIHHHHCACLVDFEQLR